MRWQIQGWGEDLAPPPHTHTFGQSKISHCGALVMIQRFCYSLLMRHFNAWWSLSADFDNRCVQLYVKLAEMTKK